jgi:hypothetical protein
MGGGARVRGVGRHAHARGRRRLGVVNALSPLQAPPMLCALPFSHAHARLGACHPPRPFRPGGPAGEAGGAGRPACPLPSTTRSKASSCAGASLAQHAAPYSRPCLATPPEHTLRTPNRTLGQLSSPSSWPCLASRCAAQWTLLPWRASWHAAMHQKKGGVVRKGGRVAVVVLLRT